MESNADDGSFDETEEVSAADHLATGGSGKNAVPPANTTSAPAAPAEDSAPRIALSKRKFGNYELLHELGHGGMGVVYKAQQSRPNRIVALKMILAGRFAPANFYDRFEKEMHAVANLQHAHIVSLLEVDDVPYFTMPYISGKTLQYSVETEEWSLKDAVKLVLKVAGAIVHAHNREIRHDDGDVICVGVLHRDLKPSNVLLDSAREPYVTDFGLAKLMGLSDSNASSTRPGAVLGSPSYMAPEAGEGRPDLITKSSDVYGLGAVLYFVITGKPPYSGSNTAEVLQKVMFDSPPDPRSLNPELDDSLAEITTRCLARSPDDRYASAEEFSNRLVEWLDQQSAAVVRTVPQRTRRPGMLWLLLLMVAMLSYVAWKSAQSISHISPRVEPKPTAEIARMPHS